MKTSRRWVGAALGMLALALLHGGPAVAEDALSGDAIKALVGGSTVEGSMSDGMAYSEFYAEDGTIKGKDYTGAWTVEGDGMCFVYGDPAAKSCYQVAGDAAGLTWMKDGAVAGQGTVTKGNVRNY